MDLASSSSDKDLCDTCSGDTDDVTSVCSWTTDQGDDVERHGLCPSPMCMSPILGNVGCPGGPLPMCSDSYPRGSIPMCLGYMPSLVPVCFVIMPTGENTIPWPHANMMQMPMDGDGHWSKPAQCSVQAPGQWSKPACKGYTATQHAKTSTTTYDAGSSDSNQHFIDSKATTVILRKLPTKCTRDMLLQLLDDEGFSGAYDFLHLPTDFQTKAGLGYALLNLVTHDMALSIQQHFKGFKEWPCPSDNECEVAWNSPHQGLATHIDRYRNSPLMHAGVPETYQPVLFRNGVRVRFPSPNKKIRAPRIRHPKPSAAIKA